MRYGFAVDIIQKKWNKGDGAKYIMKYLIGSIVTIIIGYIFSGMLSGVGVSDAYMSYINEVTLSVIFLSGIVSFWGYLILDKLNKEKDLNEDIKNTCNKK